MQLTLAAVDAGGSSAFTIDCWKIADEQGKHATVRPIAGGNSANATFTKGGE